MKQNRTLFVLFAGFVVVLGAVLIDRSRPSTEERLASAERLWPGFDRSSVQRIEIERAGGSVQLIRREGTFWVNGALPERADEGAIESLLSAIEFADVARRLPFDEQTKKQSGFKTPRAVLSIAGRSLELGGDAPGSRLLYAHYRGSAELLVTERRLFELVDRGPGGWLEQRD